MLDMLDIAKTNCWKIYFDFSCNAVNVETDNNEYTLSLDDNVVEFMEALELVEKYI